MGKPIGNAAMRHLAKAVWFIESHSFGPIGLDDVAQAVGISRHHLSRTFHRATGRSLFAYLRGRRLTEAARSLAGGAPDILALAVEAQYGSHEAFTRAFRGQFGVTPDQARGQADLTSPSFVEPLRMQVQTQDLVAPPRFVEATSMRFAGFEGTYSHAGAGGIPGQWQRLMQHIGHVPGQKGDVAYGVVYNQPVAFTYLTAVEIGAKAKALPEFVVREAPAQTYAVFRHDGHVSTLQTTCAHLETWLPKSGFAHTGPLDFFERYGPGFDPVSGFGDIEVWFPIKPAA